MLAHVVPPIEEVTTITKNMCDEVHTTGLFLSTVRRSCRRADRAVIAVVSNTHMAMMILTGLDLLTPEQVACWNVKPAGNCLHQLIAGHGKAIQIAAAGYWVP